MKDKGNYNNLDPLDGRYYDEEVSRYLSEEARVAYQAQVEAALVKALSDFGVCSVKVAQEVEQAIKNVTAAEVYEEEIVTKHDIKALVNCIKQKVSDNAKPFVHFGATSYDIISTAQALQFRAVTKNVLLPRANNLLATLINLADEHKDTIQIGRTHGQHAVPITFGYAIAGYVSRLGASAQALDALAHELPGKFSGAVGAYNALSIFIEDPMKFEQAVLAKLSLQPAEYSTQITPPEAIIRLIDEMVIMGGIMSNLAHDMRHLQRTEIAEVQEKFEKGQTGSSTMAHKRNPWNFENIISMNKQLQAQMLNANLNIASEHQRDLTDSASSRFYTIAPALLASMTQRLHRSLSKIEVNKDIMQRNLHITGGAIAAEPLYLLFEKYGHTQAHELAKNIAHEALSKNRALSEMVQSDNVGKKYWNKFTSQEKNIISSPEKYYTGLASKKTAIILKKWSALLHKGLSA